MAVVLIIIGTLGTISKIRRVDIGRRFKEHYQQSPPAIGFVSGQITVILKRNK